MPGAEVESRRAAEALMKHKWDICVPEFSKPWKANFAKSLCTATRRTRLQPGCREYWRSLRCFPTASFGAASVVYGVSAWGLYELLILDTSRKDMCARMRACARACLLTCVSKGLHLSPHYPKNITLVSFSRTNLRAAKIHPHPEHRAVEGWSPAR